MDGLVLEELTPVKVMGATLWFRLTWDEYLRMQKDIAALPDDDPLAQIEYARKTVCEHLERVDGLKDRAGNPVEWSPELFGKLSPRQVKAIIEALGRIGDAENPTTDDPTAEPAGS